MAPDRHGSDNSATDREAWLRGTLVLMNPRREARISASSRYVAFSESDRRRGEGPGVVSEIAVYRPIPRSFLGHLDNLSRQNSAPKKGPRYALRDCATS